MKARWPAVLVGFVLVAMLVRLTVKDRVPGIAALFYATPPVLLAAGALVVAAGWARQGRRRPAGTALAFAAVLASWYGVTAFSWRPQSPATRSLVLWNVAGRPAGEELLRQQADIICLVEAGRSRDEELAGYERCFPGKGLGLLARGRIGGVRLESLGTGGRAAVVELEGLTVVIVDIEPSPLMARAEPLERLATLLAELRGPVIVAGDFNTPRDSALLAPLRARFVHAFEEVGRGLDATWPWPLPVLSIDQIWVNAGVRAAACRHGGGPASDHRWVRLDFDVLESPPAVGYDPSSNRAGPDPRHPRD